MSEQEEQGIEQIDGGLQQAMGGQEAEFSAEQPRKQPLGRGTALLIVLAAAGIAGTWFLYIHGGPRAADAAHVAQARADDQTINSFLSNSVSGRRLMEQLLHNTQNVVERFLAYPSATQIPLRDLKTNPFRQQTPPAQAKPDMSRMQQEQQEAARRAAILKSARNLRLQSIIHSDQLQACMINNSLYRQGQQVGEFTVESIQPNAVIVKSGPYRFELTMGR